MESDPLQQLRDVHLPADPSWWPPAVGWWLLTVLLILLAGWLLERAWQAWRKRAPLRQARLLLNELFNAHAEGQITATEFLHQSNELLKRVLVRAYGRARYAPMAGQTWLQALDELSGTDHFSNGSGSVLGNVRFSANPEVNVDALHRDLQQVLARIKP